MAIFLSGGRYQSLPTIVTTSLYRTSLSRQISLNVSKHACKITLQCTYAMSVYNAGYQFFMHLIMERFNDIYTYSTFFYPKLQRDGYLAVCQWNRGVNIFSKRLLLFPVYLERGAHWCLAVVNIVKKTITYFDSLKNENFVCLKVLQEYLIQESQSTAFHSAVWHSNHQKNIPVQMNSFDCGCSYAHMLCIWQKTPNLILRKMICLVSEGIWQFSY